MRGEVTVREARPEENDGLIALDAACSMGEAVALRFDRSPDFFARAAAYERAIVLVAEVAGRLVGVGAAAIKVLRVGGIVGPWAYLFDLRVAPEARRGGPAGPSGRRGVAGDPGCTRRGGAVLPGPAGPARFRSLASGSDRGQPRRGGQTTRGAARPPGPSLRC